MKASRSSLAAMETAPLARSGRSPMYFRAIEVGQVNLTLGTLGLIANALEVEAHELLRPAHLVRRGRGRAAKKKR